MNLYPTQIKHPLYLLAIAVFTFIRCTEKTDINPGATEIKPVKVWTTTKDATTLLNLQELDFQDYNENFPLIKVDSAIQYQSVDGFGYTLTGGSACLINEMDSGNKNILLNELFSCGENSICVSYLRISLGASDLSKEVFSYCDLPAGAVDMELHNFSLAADTIDVIPTLKNILNINPNIKILASPWSAPVWMKSGKSSVGGKLLPEFYPVYAQYFVKYIKAMAKHGISIDAVTVQNEPQHGGNNPSMVMSSAEQKEFVKNHLGPAFNTAGIKTKIIIWDHNCDNFSYPLDILNDAEAKKYIDGTAFHLYAGEIGALSLVHNAHPDKSLYFTEQWTGSSSKFSDDLVWHIKNVIIGSMRNWGKVALEWNLASDPELKLHTPGGCSQCLGAVTINKNTFQRNVSYYIVAHASKLVLAGSKRISSSWFESIPNVAFLRPDGRKVLIIMNEGSSTKSINVGHGKNNFILKLNPASINTVVW